MRELAMAKSPDMLGLQAALLELIQILQPDCNIGNVTGTATANSSVALDIQPPKTTAEIEWIVYLVEFRVTGTTGAADSIELRWRDELISTHFVVGYSLLTDFVDGRFVWPQFLPSKSTQLMAEPLVPLCAKLRPSGETWKRPTANLLTDATVGTRALSANFLYAPRNRLFD